MTKQYFIEMLFTMQDLFAKFPQTDTYPRDQVISLLTYIAKSAAKIEIDTEKLKEVMNRLMLDTHDKAEIIKAMEEE